jgi:hypothetical protein
MQFANLSLLFSLRTVTLESLLNRVQQILVPKGLRQKFHGTRFQCPNGHGNVSVRGNKDDGYLRTKFDEPSLKIESAHLRKSHVQDQATWLRTALSAQKLFTS